MSECVDGQYEEISEGVVHYSTGHSGEVVRSREILESSSQQA